MIGPSLSVSLWNIGKPQLVNNVAVVVRETRSKQSLHVFEYEPLGLNVPNRPNRFREHVALIRVSQVLAADGKRLTGGAAGHQLDAPFIRLEVMVSHVALHNLPVPHVLHTISPVTMQCSARVAIPIQDRDVLESGAGRPKREAPSTDKEFKRFDGSSTGSHFVHFPSLLERVRGVSPSSAVLLSRTQSSTSESLKRSNRLVQGAASPPAWVHSRSMARSNSAKAPNHLYHHPVCRSRGVDRLGQTPESGANFRELLHDREHVAQRARQPIQLSNNDHIISGTKLIE